MVTPERGVRAWSTACSPGWHEPEASHLLMLEAIAGPQALRAGLRRGGGQGYLWHEFGDTHLILPGRARRS